MIPPPGPVLDVAAGSGRHTRLLAQLGLRVLAVDRDAQALESLSALPSVEILAADLEAGAWPLGERRFAGVVVTHYLHRPLMPMLLAAIEPCGILIYETFARGNERYGRPSNPAFLLEPGELLRWTAGRMRVLAYEDLYVTDPKPAMIQRICALRE
jgi:SAM-dependent methyltransferase